MFRVFSEHLMCVDGCLLLGCGGYCKSVHDGAGQLVTGFLGSAGALTLYAFGFHLRFFVNFHTDIRNLFF